MNTIETMHLTNQEFGLLSKLVYSQCGNKMPLAKKILLESRLQKRLRVLNFATFKEYIQYLTSKDGMSKELVHMIDVITTNKTDFFREIHHFEYLEQTILPQLYRAGNRNLKIWSAACSSGEEPYTLAMYLEDFSKINSGLSYTILASDISTQVLQKAEQAVYTLRQADDIPMEYKRKYLLKSKDKINATVRIIPELRRNVRFERINLMDNVLPVEEKLDIIFCRNVLIYFDRETQLKVVGKLVDCLKPGGNLFIGHSESLFQMDLPIKQIIPTVYQKQCT